MTLLAKCEHYCRENNLFSCQAILVGVSGGADSMCLLDILFSMQKASDSFPFVLVAHLNHGLRGIEADGDALLVETYCKVRSIPFYHRQVSVASLSKVQKISLEEAGRKARYDFFNELAREISFEHGLVHIAVAHHSQDQAETILMNLFRGSGLSGLCGMKARQNNIIRPLLFATKQEINTYLQEKQIPFSEDSSNSENIYTRNKWRNQILPLIAQVSPKDPTNALLQTAALLEQDKEYFDTIVLDLINQHKILIGSQGLGLPVAIILEQPTAISSRLIRSVYQINFSDEKDLGSEHVKAIYSIIRANKNGSRVSICRGRTAYITEGALFFALTADLFESKLATWSTTKGTLLLANQSMEEEVILTHSKKLELYNNLPTSKDNIFKQTVVIPKSSHKVVTICVENMKQVVYNGQTWYCSLVDLQGAVLRTKRQGDWFWPAGSTGKKPLRRFFNDMKVPAFLRDRILVVAKGAQILWIPGLSHSIGFVDELSQSPYLLAKGLTAYHNSRQWFECEPFCRVTILDNTLEVNSKQEDM